ncbi:hypothetical protein C1893_23220 [Pseudomonas sp. MPR-ANC1]|uniref:hypothetical protein n=1 Tax=Pseudomonas sp. MPR-ANC1 TaxID=2075548 RepID=UPI000CD1EA57|nr:hypothetical protein [Pseudomonas sp. MPR-ANC1]POA45570.1 hypothetical protein C1893_23220 [Pseudomonas sp. MPR-ANC1]
MSIIRAARKSQFYVLPTTTIEDNRLSWEARGMLVYLLSKPDHWEVRVEDLLARTRNCLGKRSGRDKVYGILKELQMSGYVIRRYDRQGGTFKGMTYEVSETPDLAAGAAFIASQKKDKAPPVTANPETVAPVTDLPDTVQPDPAKPDALVNNKQAVSTERAVKNLTANPVGAETAQSAANSPIPLGDTVGVGALSDDERKALSQAPDNYPQNPASKTFRTWLAYAMAFNAKYRQWPIFNATLGGQMAKVVERIGQDIAPLTARYYVEAVKTPAIADNCHPISSLLRHCESYVVKAQAQEKQRARRADTERVVEAAAKAAAKAAPTTVAPAIAPKAGAKSEITNVAKEARAKLGQLVGGPMKERLTA